MCDMTHPYVRSTSLASVDFAGRCVIDMCDMTHWYVTWLMDMCDMAHWYVWHDALICDMIYWYVWHDSLMHEMHFSTTMNESCHIHDWVMSHISMTHVTYQCATSQKYQTNFDLQSRGEALLLLLYHFAAREVIWYSWVMTHWYVTWFIDMCDMTQEVLLLLLHDFAARDVCMIQGGVES